MRLSKLAWLLLLSAPIPAATAAVRDVHIPVAGTELLTRLWVPDGPGPHPAIVLNHGAPRRAEDRAKRPDYPAAARWFYERGFVVAVPARRGYGPGGGVYAESFGSCDRPDYIRAGKATAVDIAAVLKWLRRQPYVDRARLLAQGQSAGGFGVLAVAARRPQGLLAVLNFAGGRGSPAANRNCSEKALVTAVGHFARDARVPALFVYAQNDTFFWPRFARRIYSAWAQASPARATFVQLPAYANDGHRVFGSADGPALWGPVVADFLRTLGFQISAGPEALEWREQAPEWRGLDDAP